MMKKMYLLFFLITIGFSNEFDDYLAKQAQKAIHITLQCTPYKETGLLWGFNNLVGESPIIVKTKKHGMNSEFDHIEVDGKKLTKIGSGYFENKTIRLEPFSYLTKYKNGEEYQIIDKLRIATDSKTTWYHCMQTERKVIFKSKK